MLKPIKNSGFRMMSNKIYFFGSFNMLRVFAEPQTINDFR